MQNESRFYKMRVNLQILVLFRPFFWTHSGSGFENSEECGIRSKARFITDVGDLDVGCLAQQLLGVFNTIIIDELVERTAFLRVDAGRDGVAMHSKRISHIADFQILVKINLLCLHQLDDASHKLVGGDFRFGAVPPVVSDSRDNRYRK